MHPATPFNLSVHALSVLLVLGLTNIASAQSFGVELHNTVMPASGGMGGVSVAQPQDFLSAINGNPATLTQYRGTQFTMGAGWADANYELTHTGNGALPGIGPFMAGSGTPGSSLPNIGVSQDLSVLGRPVTAGVALISTAGLGVDFAAEPNSNEAALTFQVLTLSPGVGVRLTDRLSAGANFGLGVSLLDGLFVGSSKATPAYGARASFGLNYDIDRCTRIGGYYQSKETFIYEDAIILQPFVGLPGRPLDVEIDLPPNIAFGISNTRLANGHLLLAADVVYKFWEDAALFDAIYNNQLIIQLGAQYSMRRAKLRLGYVWAENAMIENPGIVINGIMLPGGTNALQYIQGLASNINQHRLSAGIGVPNVLPGIDLDMFAGGMFQATDTYGLTTASVGSYFLGGGLTWRFGRGSGCQLAPNEWCSGCGNGSCCE